MKEIIKLANELTVGDNRTELNAIKKALSKIILNVLKKEGSITPCKGLTVSVNKMQPSQYPKGSIAISYLSGTYDSSEQYVDVSGYFYNEAIKHGLNITLLKVVLTHISERLSRGFTVKIKGIGTVMSFLGVHQGSIKLLGNVKLLGTPSFMVIPSKKLAAKLRITRDKVLISEEKR